MESEQPSPLAWKNVTLLFSDVNNYVQLAKMHPLNELTQQLKEYLRLMHSAVESNAGTVLTYSGSAVLALFGYPGTHVKHPHQALTAATDMHKSLLALNKYWHEDGKLGFDVTMALNTGMAMVGLQGSSEYAAIGDAVNDTGRLQKLTTQFNVTTILSESTYSEIKAVAPCRSLGSVQLSHSQAQCEVYELIN